MQWDQRGTGKTYAANDPASCSDTPGDRQAHHNEQAVRELEALAPYPGSPALTVERVTSQRKWVTYYGGLAWNRQDFAWDANLWQL